MMKMQERIAGGFYGLLVGDALGVPYEFKHHDQIPPLESIEMTPPADFSRTYASVPVGTWSDDGAQALALLDSLLSCGRLDLNDLIERIAAWEDSGKYAVGGVVFDIGITTSAAISNFRRGHSAETCGPTDTYSNGNGALMRVLPLALWHRGDDAQLARDAMAQSLVTHGHTRSQVCCALYCLWARFLLRGEDDAWPAATGTLRALIKDTPAEAELEFHVRPDDAAPGRGSGYVVDSLRSARALMTLGDYEIVVKNAVALGSDTDTTACIAGGVAGVRDGQSAIPPRWMELLRGREIADPLLSRLLDWVA